jgi:D-alanyl-D-alanine carboxypeptidase
VLFRFFQRRLLWALLILVLGLTACAAPAATNPEPTVVPTMAPTEAPMEVPTVEPTAAVVAESSPATPEAPAVPTSAAAPTAEPTPEPTAPPEPAIAPFDVTLAAELQAVLDAAVADGYIPGAVLAVSIPGQEPWTGASGIADRSQNTPITPDTRMRIASISKIFTAVTVLQLAEEGVINLDAPMSTWLPGLVPAAEQITVRSLLQHTTGLYDFLEDGSYVGQAYQNGRVFEPEELVAYAARFPGAFAPGAPNSWDYSSTNYVILGMIVEAATGEPLETQMRARIFTPLGLEGTFFVPREEISGTQARGYSRTTDQTSVAMSFGYATANIVSTASDIQRFIDALFAGEVLNADSLAQMTTFVDGKGQYNMPQLAYGLGLMRNRLPSGTDEQSTVYGHIGGFGGFRSATWHAPESGITIALNVNQAAMDPNTLAATVWEVLLRYQD